MTIDCRAAIGAAGRGVLRALLELDDPTEARVRHAVTTARFTTAAVVAWAMATGAAALDATEDAVAAGEELDLAIEALGDRADAHLEGALGAAWCLACAQLEVAYAQRFGHGPVPLDALVREMLRRAEDALERERERARRIVA